ncbi:uroporphyrinogen-III synthase [Flavobacterium sp. j3]|uniref:Uroporphyrinogen-III synthase n=1 Tax=Flavobacterium aureirubrum TaxID=3133147 RepID=A0ABU9N116_9FLAO
MTKQINIVSTKKLLPNQKQLLLDRDFVVIEEDFIATKIKNFELSKINDNLIFTSQNAVQSVLQNPNCSELKSKNVFCIGLKTKKLLAENGFNVIAYTGYAADLAEIISLIYNKESYTFFSGNLRRDILPNTLKENGIAFNEIEVYETSITSKKVTSKVDGILFFSPSAVESYLKLNTIKNEFCFCIGDTTAETLEKNNINNIIIAEKPSVENVLEAVIYYF